MQTKKEKAILKKQFQSQKMNEFEQSLPMKKDKFIKLFDFLDNKLSEEGCDNTLKFTELFFKQNNISNIEDVKNWLEEQGGYCDCEVLANVEEGF